MRLPRLFLRSLSGIAVLLAGSAFALAGELLPPETPIETVVDHYIDARLADEKIEPAELVDDLTFLRRVTLDLAGRIPLAHEAREFAASTEPEKRRIAVERLLASPDFKYHQRNEFYAMLMSGRGDDNFRNWLLKVIEDERPWNQVFRDVMLSRESVPEEKPALGFLRTRARDVDDLANDTSRLFFGVNVSCAKCHDHPHVHDWTQDHFYGMASFFNRTYLTGKNFLAERSRGRMRFKTTDGEDKDARLMFLTGAIVEEPAAPDLDDKVKKELEAREKADNDSETPPEAPAFSPRARLVELALAPENSSYFSRSIVNRLWARLFGQGLVHPVDQMHSANPASHPELLDWLARDAEIHEYNLKRLVRGFVLSRAYSRSSRYEKGELPDAKFFALAPVRALTPMQYSLSLSIASANPEQYRQVSEKPEDWANRRRDLDNHSRGLANDLEYPTDNFQIGVSESMLLSNSPRVQNEYLRDGGDRLVGVMKAEPDTARALDILGWTAYSRPLESDEIQIFTQYQAARQDRTLAGLQQLVWSLLTSPEFRFNY